jgi:hypothetical protein
MFLGLFTSNVESEDEELKMELTVIWLRKQKFCEVVYQTLTLSSPG